MHQQSQPAEQTQAAGLAAFSQALMAALKEILWERRWSLGRIPGLECCRMLSVFNKGTQAISPGTRRK